MRKLFKNFTWPAFAAYAIVFFFTTFIFDLISGRFHEPDIKLSKVIIGYLISVLGFGFFMSLFFGKKVLEKTKKEKQ